MLVDAFTRTARKHPERPAIVHNGQSITYAELENLIHAATRRLGPGPGVVAVPAAHTPATVVELFGVWAAGGTYCPVDPAFPAERRSAMLTTALETRAEAAAYILFTSGSTGAPKPVAVSHPAIGIVTESLRELFALTPDDRVLQFASLNWDTCFEEILPTLTTGACLVFDDDAYSGSFPRLLRMLARQRITVLDLPTAFWHELVHHLREERLGLPECVRLMIIGGEAVSPARLADWSTLEVSRVKLLNTYGCTETVLITHAAELTTTVMIGRALPHVVERITDDGELLIGGLGDGFVSTGDRVSRLPDGNLIHLGRVDGELKIRGIRVNPAEVEAQIAGHPAVSAVAVTGVPVANHTVLAAFVVPRDPAGGADPACGADPALGADILDYLRQRVPAHLVPSRISIVAELAYTASGKVDRRSLKEMHV